MTESDLYINIHSHHESNDKAEFVIKNIFVQDFETNKNFNAPFCSVGLHPWHIKDGLVEERLQKIETLANSREIIAIGEAGLDRNIDTDIGIQINIFTRQLEIAEKFKKPVIVHCVKSYSDILAVRKTRKINIPWIIHGFNENELIANKLILSGCFLSFGHLILNRSTKASRTFIKIPADNIFFETDESDMEIKKIYRVAAEKKNIEINILKNQIIKNFNNCFLSSIIHKSG
ncbi:MAG: TatD family hydrolase [Bacteroidia bacterium]|nr:TatD family hydrolase [Bacteroidia bacterium]